MMKFLTQLPIDSLLDTVSTSLVDAPSCLLVAAPGAGKTTRIPLALLAASWRAGKKILMLEPRRLAARRAAEYMARLLGERCGDTVGYRIRTESRVSSKTQIEVVTEGILTRMIQDNPELAETALIIFDEFHERSIHADLGLALAIDVQRHLRNDLRILVMSATMDGAAVASLLHNAPVLRSEGRIFPVDTRYLRFSVQGQIEQRIADVIQESLRQDEGDILLFLPGRREIRRLENILFERLKQNDVLIVPLYGDLPSSEQDVALLPDNRGRRKIILSTSVAETSITIDGVRIVIDSGLSRASRFDPRRGMSGLVTLPVSKATADQRRGRAGRQQPGICYRLWTEQEQEALTNFPQPEIVSSDLAPFALELASWGVADASSLSFLDPPPLPHLQQAQSLLRSLGAITAAGRLTPHGKAMAALPIHPRLAHMIISANSIGLGSMACELAALLEERENTSGGTSLDLSATWHQYHKKPDDNARTARQVRRFKQITNCSSTNYDESAVGLLLSLAYPERIARKKESGRASYITVQGTTVRLPDSSLLGREEYLVFADVDGIAAEAKAFLAAPITKEEILRMHADAIIHEELVGWDAKSESVRASRITRIGAITFSEQQIQPDEDAVLNALCDGIRILGINCLPWDTECSSLRNRSEWLRNGNFTGEDWPNLSEAWLLNHLEEWLVPYLGGIRKRTQFAMIPLAKALKALYSYQQLRELDRLAPKALGVPSGSSVNIDYASGPLPVLAVKLQEMFGLVESPRLADGRSGVLIHLLSPARRPLAVTQDLKSFWITIYPEIRKQMRADYPKHPWPEDPLTAKPTKKTNRALRKEF
jgi:ATP-dependent helicase HrpB